ncbi:MAG TPA: hypothetical protein ENI87_13065 [bacterium]|nr:hypothetical protein [bacterium]
MRIGKTVVLALLASPAIAQGPPHNGPRPVDPDWFALQGARVTTAPGEVIDGATVVMRAGRITAIGADVAVPDGATAIDCTGLSIYPGLIEPFLPTDVPALDDDATDKHWNPMVQPQRSALDGALVPEKEREQLRALGFTAVAAAPSGGILKGTSTVILLDEPTAETTPRIVRDRAYAVASLQTNRRGYPSSEMGAIALLRQSLSDGDWYERCRAAVARDPALLADAPQPSRVLAAIAAQRRLPLWFDTRNELQALRCLRVAAEFGRQPVLVGSGMEFRRLQALADAGAPIVVPLQLPDPPDVSTAAAADRVTLRQLQSWEQAPSNSRRLLDAGMEIAWTTARLNDRKDFFARVRDARSAGVTATQALAAVTTVPAKLLGIDRDCGTIAVGKFANLVVCDGELFAAATTVRDVWIGGRRHTINEPKDQGLDGTWAWTAGFPGTGTPTLTIDGKELTVTLGDDELKVTGVDRQPAAVTCRLQGEALGEGQCWLRLHREDEGLGGQCTTTDGRSLAVTATPAPPAHPADEAAEEAPDAASPPPPPELPTPLGGYGFVELPEQQTFAIVGATVWTMDGRGRIDDGAIYVVAGKIRFAGTRADLPELAADCVVIDGAGKHVTPGIIDCHSHTGISRGINEGGQAVTSEVRIQDVVNPDDVNWYRQLAGGVTTVNQLHGSANAIGGQSNTVKVRYGVRHPNDMFFVGAKPGIKFALGENPRRVNWRSGEPNRRYPTTRMGVEALLRDRFAAAEDYARRHAAYRELPPKERARVLPPRVDFELQALAEVLARQRWIHCHSYRQDEIFMLCELANEYAIKIGTFQHVLEGYKVADAIAKSAVGASSFSDWWAYKFEVYDAIPHNGAILHERGVVVSFNSDSNEHARRLNTEAGKAVKYGGVPEAEALQFVTRNPAIQLGVFNRTGSLTHGKDADLVLWSDHPLRYAAICERTWVDGRLLFSLERDRELRAAIGAERHRLLQLALAKGKQRHSEPGDPKDAYWRAEEYSADYCCKNDLGGRR